MTRKRTIITLLIGIAATVAIAACADSPTGAARSYDVPAGGHPEAALTAAYPGGVEKSSVNFNGTPIPAGST
ncbi:MAG TPA: hypothetical protein VMH39_17165, partial [Gemmatimonadaceae bacterium]|nr:hypothetical protein [Gemmatimonadaceae bacterium]